MRSILCTGARRHLTRSQRRHPAAAADAALQGGPALLVLICWKLRKQKPMFERELPRIYELRSIIADPEAPNSYLRNLDASLSQSSLKLEYFRVLEADLRELDETAWFDFKKELKPLLIARDAQRGWQALFDVLHHVKAYVHLKRSGCTGIRFVKQPRKKNQSVVDLEADRGGRLVLCEVKTINVSENEILRRLAGGVGTSGNALTEGFYAKLNSDLAKAACQLTAYANGRDAECKVFVAINFDDHLHEYADRYGADIETHLTSNPLSGIAVVVDIKGPFEVSY